MNVKVDENVHTSVLLQELVDHIDIRSNRQNIVVDGTLGLAGHACKVLEKMNSGDTFIGFDADERNLILAKERLKQTQTQLPHGNEIHIVLIHSNFEFIKKELLARGIEHITSVYYDLGVSSLHFDEAERGFSLRQDGPLDMRFDTRSGRTAADILNFSEEKDLFEILRSYGEEPHARKIAAKVIARRKQSKFSTTTDLNDFLDSEINKHIKTKMRVYQALRIEANRELEALKISLRDATELLAPGGDLFVISFHSLEDRITKQFMKTESRDCICSDIICSCKHTKSLKITTKKPILPSTEEQNSNPRSRSAKARHATKI